MEVLVKNDNSFLYEVFVLNFFLFGKFLVVGWDGLWMLLVYMVFKGNFVIFVVLL